MHMPAVCPALGLVGNKGAQPLSSKGLTHPASGKAGGDWSGELSPLPGGLGWHGRGWGLGTQELSRVLEGVAVLAADTYGEGSCACGHAPGSQTHISCISKQAWGELGS